MAISWYLGGSFLLPCQRAVFCWCLKKQGAFEDSSMFSCFAWMSTTLSQPLGHKDPTRSHQQRVWGLLARMQGEATDWGHPRSTEENPLLPRRHRWSCQWSLWTHRCPTSHQRTKHTGGWDKPRRRAAKRVGFELWLSKRYLWHSWWKQLGTPSTTSPIQICCRTRCKYPAVY